MTTKTASATGSRQQTKAARNSASPVRNSATGSRQMVPSAYYLGDYFADLAATRRAYVRAIQQLAHAQAVGASPGKLEEDAAGVTRWRLIYRRCWREIVR